MRKRSYLFSSFRATASSQSSRLYTQFSSFFERLNVGGENVFFFMRKKMFLVTTLDALGRHNIFFFSSSFISLKFFFIRLKKYFYQLIFQHIFKKFFFLKVYVIRRCDPEGVTFSTHFFVFDRTKPLEIRLYNPQK